MNKNCFLLALCAVFAVGCGGGGGGTDAGGDSQTLSLGPVVTNVSGAIPAPLITSSSGVVVTGVSGGRVNDLRVKNPPMNSLSAEEVAAQTQIAFNQQGRPALYNYGTGDVITIAQGSGDPGLTEMYLDISPDGTKIVSGEQVSGVYQIILRNIDGSNPVQLTTGGGLSNITPHFSADGTRILYCKALLDLTSSKIYSMKLDGTANTLISGGFTDICPSPSSDGTKIAFMRVAAGVLSVWVMNSDGTNRHQISPVDADTTYTAILDWAPFGNSIVTTSAKDGIYSVVTVQGDKDQTQVPLKLFTNGDFKECPSYSPDGNLIAFHGILSNGTEGLVTIPAYPTTTQHDLLERHYNILPSWGPYIQERRFLGAAPNVMGTSGGGFIFGQQGMQLTSLVSFDAVTRTGVTLSKQGDSSPDQPNVIVTIQSSDELTSLQYVNSMLGNPIKVITGSPSTHAVGAIVSFDSKSGRVATVVPYGDMQGASREKGSAGKYVAKGRFLGVWDGSGKNVAPSGATEVTIDETTGALISHS